MPKVESFIQKYFPDADYFSGEYHCRCPAHNDIKESLHITQGDDPDGNGGTKIVMNCKAGCSNNDILKQLGASWSEINGSSSRNAIKKKITLHYKSNNLGECTDIYDYKDPEGNYLYSRLRFRRSDGSKDMRYCRIDYQKEAVISYSRGCDPVPYNLPEVLDSINKGYPVYITEGEKDVHTLHDQLNYIASTAGSASDWKPQFARWFRGARVVIFPDNDKAGKKAIERMQKDLLKCAYQVKVVYTSKAEHGDVTDYLEEGNTPDDLKELIDSQEWIPAEWLTVDKKNKHTINTDLLAGCIDQNEKYLIVRQPGDDRDTLYCYQRGVYQRVSKNLFIADVIRPYIPKGRATAHLLDNTLKLLLTAGTHSVSYDQLDQDQRYINVSNGLLDIDSWELKPHSPDVLSTIQLNVSYIPGSRKKENFDHYIRDLVRNPDGSEDGDKARVIQEYFGMVLSNIPMFKLKKALFLVSFIGNTGKSSLLRLIDEMLGNGRTAAIDLKDLDTGSGNRFMLGAMRGKRLIECGDQSSATINDSSTFKRLTGGDLQKIEEKGKQGDYFRFTGGVVIASNQIPYFADDHGQHMIDRLQIIPLQHTIPVKDSSLEERILQEKSAVFNWFMEGLKRVRANNYQLTECGAVTSFVQEYRESSDSVYRYLMEHYEITNNQKDLVGIMSFYYGYRDWCSSINTNMKRDERVAVVGKKKNVKQRMISYGIGFTESGTSKHIYCYVGIKRKDDKDESERDG